MIISEQQLLQLISIAIGYQYLIKEIIEKNMATGDAKETMDVIRNLLTRIRSQQSEELKDIK